MHRLLLFFPLFFFVDVTLFAQSGCPGCVTNLPANLPNDTIYLPGLPNGVKDFLYDHDISFRMPKTTPAGIANWPPGLPISAIRIDSITGLPPGLSWEASQKEFETDSAETDGCVRICGTPLASGLFVATVHLKATIGPFVLPVTFTTNLYIADFFAMTNAEGCGSTTVLFNNNIPSNGVPGFSYQWDFGDGTMFDGENPPPHTYSQPGIYEVRYTAVIDTAGLQEFIFTDTVTVYPLPVAPIITSEALIACPGESIVLTSSYSGTNQWLADGEPVPGATGSIFSPNESGSYQVQATSEHGCTALSDPVPVGFLLLPIAYFEIVSVNESLTVTLSNLSQHGNTYTWSFGDGQTLSTNDPTVEHKYAAPGTYTIQLSAQNECDTSTIEIILGIVSTEIPAWLPTLHVYPNPNNGDFTVEMGSAVTGEAEYSLYDPAGRLVRRQTAESGGNGSPVVRAFNFSDLPPALYLLHIRAKEGTAVMKVSVQR